MDITQSYFELFNLSAGYEIDLARLDERYLALQKEVHPDKFVKASDQEQRLAMQWTTFLNAAIETLKDPMARAVYLLELKGVEIAHNPALPPEFLMQQIELREELEDIEANASLDALDAFKKQANGVRAGIETAFSEAIESNLNEAETLVYEMQFVTKLLIEADHLEEKLLEY